MWARDRATFDTWLAALDQRHLAPDPIRSRTCASRALIVLRRTPRKLERGGPLDTPANVRPLRFSTPRFTSSSRGKWCETLTQPQAVDGWSTADVGPAARVRPRRSKEGPGGRVGPERLGGSRGELNLARSTCNGWR